MQVLKVDIIFIIIDLYLFWWVYSPINFTRFEDKAL